MSVQAEAWVERHSPFTGATYIMHRAIGEVVDEKLDFYARLTEYAKKLRIERKTLGVAVQRLVAGGFLEVVESPFTSEGKPTGKPGVYRFVFVAGLPVVYDGKKRIPASAAEAPIDGGESIDAPPENDRSARESHEGVSAGPRAESATDSAPESGGESFDARREYSPGESIDAPGASIHARGESSLLTECNELDPTPSNAEIALVEKSPSALVRIASGSELEETSTPWVFNEHLADGTVQRRDALWEVTLAAFGYRPEELSATERGRLNKAVKDLRGAGAHPAEITSRLNAYRALFPHAACTVSALASRWAECNPERVEQLVATPTLDGNDLALAQAARNRAEGRRR